MQLINNATTEKLRGGFYTPEVIADFILAWALQDGGVKKDLLEPSCGDGVFLERLKDLDLTYGSMTAIENNPIEANKARKIGLRDADVLTQDFHKFCTSTEQKFDVIIGNPPYIRYQYFDRKQQEYASKIFDQAGLSYSKLTNAWVSFVVGSSLLLRDSGKIAFVLPAEILQVSFAKQLRSFLAYFYNNVNIISFEQLVFPNIQQEVVLLLCEKNNSQAHSINHFELKDTDGLKDFAVPKSNGADKQVDFMSNKWTFYFLSQKEINFLDQIKTKYGLSELNKFATVEVGITTGSNPFFTVNQDVVNEFNLSKYAKPMVGRSVQVSGLYFTERDWEKNCLHGARAHLLAFPMREKISTDSGAAKYLELGEEHGVNDGYKCRIRDEWQIVPSLRTSDALFIRRNNKYPRLIINDANAYTTDTMHRVSIRDDVNIEAFTASYYNSLSLAFAEICGRSHGGGVLELMPNEAEKILIPYHVTNKDLTKDIDQRLRDGEDIEQVLDYTDEIILEKNFGFKPNEIKLARQIWKKLSARRLNRGKKNQANIK